MGETTNGGVIPKQAPPKPKRAEPTLLELENIKECWERGDSFGYCAYQLGLENEVCFDEYRELNKHYDMEEDRKNTLVMIEKVEAYDENDLTIDQICELTELSKGAVKEILRRKEQNQKPVSPPRKLPTHPIALVNRTLRDLQGRGIVFDGWYTVRWAEGGAVLCENVESREQHTIPPNQIAPFIEEKKGRASLGQGLGGGKRCNSEHVMDVPNVNA